ncbi:MAG: hypothetical protein L0G70_06280, partial [Rubrobacter sp.]|nr:hypothetical protein [Rubrobacter sp.]
RSSAEPPEARGAQRESASTPEKKPIEIAIGAETATGIATTTGATLARMDARTVESARSAEDVRAERTLLKTKARTRRRYPGLRRVKSHQRQED